MDLIEHSSYTFMINLQTVCLFVCLYTSLSVSLCLLASNFQFGGELNSLPEYLYICIYIFFLRSVSFFCRSFSSYPSVSRLIQAMNSLLVLTRLFFRFTCSIRPIFKAKLNRKKNNKSIPFFFLFQLSSA